MFLALALCTAVASGALINVDPAIGFTEDLGHESTGPQQPRAGMTWEKFLLTDAVASGAVCLDGSPGGGACVRVGGPFFGAVCACGSYV
jgi:hypothetical protein